MKIICPRCNQRSFIKEIIYGMPSNDFNFEKFEVGGCCVEDESPTHFCTGCEKSFKTIEINQNVLPRESQN